MDILGFGRSPSEDFFAYTAAEQVAAIAKTIARLKIRAPLYLVGHSMGGLLAVEYASGRDVAGLVLAAPPFLLPDEQKALAKPASKSNSADSRVSEKSANFMNQFAHLKAFRAGMKNIVIKGDSWKTINRLRLPIRIIRGKFDSLTLKSNNLTLAKKHPNIKFTEVLSGHDVKGLMQDEIVKQLAELTK
jgi:pimeloyl-ACP methyl ester carboxylesterase